jgi:hypothetical protein
MTDRGWIAGGAQSARTAGRSPSEGPLRLPQAHYLVVEVIGAAAMWYISLMPNGLRFNGMTGITSTIEVTPAKKG